MKRPLVHMLRHPAWEWQTATVCGAGNGEKHGHLVRRAHHRRWVTCKACRRIMRQK